MEVNGRIAKNVEIFIINNKSHTGVDLKQEDSFKISLSYKSNNKGLRTDPWAVYDIFIHCCVILPSIIVD